MKNETPAGRIVADKALVNDLHKWSIDNGRTLRWTANEAVRGFLERHRGRTSTPQDRQPTIADLMPVRAPEPDPSTMTDEDWLTERELANGLEDHSETPSDARS